MAVNQFLVGERKFYLVQQYKLRNPSGAHQPWMLATRAVGRSGLALLRPWSGRVWNGMVTWPTCPFYPVLLHARLPAPFYPGRGLGG
jgi:hypothetical protein